MMDHLHQLNISLASIRKDIHFAQFKADGVVKLIKNSKQSSEEKLMAIERLALEIAEALEKYE